MAVSFQCNADDLREAIAGNGVWARLDAKADRLSTWVGRVGSFAMFAWIIATTNFADRSRDFTWRVSPLALVSSALMLPGFAVVIGLRSIVRARAGALPASGIIRAAVSKTSDAGKKGIAALVTWGVVLLLLGTAFFFQHLTTRVTRGIPMPMTRAPRYDPFVDGTTTVRASSLYLLIVAPPSIVLVLLGFGLRRARLRTIGRGSPTFFQPQTFQIDDEGFTLFDAHGHLRRTWAGVAAIRRN